METGKSCGPTGGPGRPGALLFGVVTILLLAVGACDTHEPGGFAGPAAVQEWDSAGVRIVQSGPEVLETWLPWTVDTVPELEIGDGFGTAAVAFHQIRGMVTTPGGDILVVDQGSGELRWFDESGADLRVRGGPGDGPGDFQSPELIPQQPGDSALIFDQRLRRFTWVAWDGSGLRVQPMPSGGPPLLAGAPAAAKDERVAFRTQGGNLQGEGLVDAPLSVRWVDLVRSTVDTIAHYDNHFLVFRRSGRALPTILDAPFEPAGLVAVRPAGLIVEGSRAFGLRYLDDAGRLSGIARVDAPGRPVDEEALQRLARDWSATEEGARELLRVLEPLDLSDTVPAFQSLMVDRLGWAWAELFRLDEADPSRWLVFDPEGVARGVIDLPEGLEVFEIGEGHILGRWEDDLGVEYVRRYRLERSQEP